MIIEAMNGIMLYMFCVQPSAAIAGMELAMFARDLNSAKNIAAKQMRNGFHWPKIMTARARKPAPDTPTSKFQLDTDGMMYAMPPMPPSAPEISTPM